MKADNTFSDTQATNSYVTIYLCIISKLRKALGREYTAHLTKKAFSGHLPPNVPPPNLESTSQSPHPA